MDDLELRITRAAARPTVIVRWALPAGTTSDDVTRTAMGIVEDVLGHPQFKPDAPLAYSPTDGRGKTRPTSQAVAPIGFREARERLATVYAESDGNGSLTALTDAGREIRINPCKSKRQGSMLARMNPRGPTFRSTPAINRRPGRGGQQRHLRRDTRAELAETYGEIRWWKVPGAMLGVLELDPEGNAVGCARLSDDDKNESFPGQLDPILAFARAREIRLRRILLAEHMSGTREVRPDRAGPPPPGVLERDDMLLLDRWIAEGWLEHVIWRDAKRIARATLPAEVLFDRWERNDIGLWLVDQGSKVDYARGRTLLTFQSAMAADDRNTLTRNMATARLFRGPMRGRGWGGAPRFGFLWNATRDELIADEEQFPYIHTIFELAETGDEGGKPLSLRQIAARLAEIGCPLNHSTIAKILRDPIYATGEWVANVGDVAIAQTPATIPNPVPLNRWQRVQAILDTREGASKNTELGEFLFNYVETVHTRCDGSTDKNGKPVRIRGYVEPARPDVRIYHHKMRTPECCKHGGRGGNGTFTWNRDDLERPVIEEIRKFATHPELLRAHAEATRHEIVSHSTSLSEEERHELSCEIERLEQQRALAAEQWLDTESSTDPDAVRASLEVFRRMDSTFDKRIKQIQTRLELDAHRAAQNERVPTETAGESLQTFLDLMSVETPADPIAKNIRARIFQRIVSRIEIADEGDGPIQITLYGHLVPHDDPGGHEHPLIACSDLLDVFRTNAADLRPASETVDSSPKESTVSARPGDHDVSELMNRPRLSDLDRARRQQPTNEGWKLGRDVPELGVPAWKATVLVNRRP